MKIKTIFICLLLLAFFSQNSQAQKEESPKRKMTIVTKTVDENGKETVTTVVKEGDEISDEEIEKLLKKATGENRNIDVEVIENDDKSKTITIKEEGEKEVKQQYKIIKKSQEVEIESDGEKEIIIEKTGDGNDDHHKMIFITEDGDVQKVEGKDVKIIKKKGDGAEKEVTVTVEAGDAEDVIWIEKMDGEEGDVIIIEEETTTETDKDGKTTKTVKKTKKVVKKGN